MSRLFSKFQVRYGHKWTSALPTPELIELAVAEWGEKLAGVSPEQVQRGLREWTGDWPPSADEFVRVCKGPVRAACQRWFVPLPKPVVDPAVAKKALAEMRKALQ